jgi:hypothetical protein
MNETKKSDDRELSLSEQNLSHPDADPFAEALAGESLERSTAILRDLGLRMTELDIPETLRDRIIQEIGNLPCNGQDLASHFSEHILHNLGKESEADQIAFLQGQLFHISRINIVDRQGLEKLSADQPSIVIDYSGYVQVPKSFSAARGRDLTLEDQRRMNLEFLDSLEPDLRKKIEAHFRLEQRPDSDCVEFVRFGGEKKLKSAFTRPPLSQFMEDVYRRGPSEYSPPSKIEIDIPLFRDGLPYVYEAKAYPRRLCGDTASTRNQALKYNEVVEKKLAAGATIEITGRIDSSYIHWSAGRGIADTGAIPNVELVYSLPLPSGREFRFVLKRGEGVGLQFKNDTREYTVEDKAVVRGVQQAVLDRSIYEILSGVNQEDFPRLRELAGRRDPSGVLFSALIDYPGLIGSQAMMEAYNEERVSALWRRFTAKGIAYLVNAQNERSVMDPEYHQPAGIMRVLVEMQAAIRENPHLAKAAYATPEENFDAIVAEATRRVATIYGREQQRIALESQAGTPEHERAERRRQLGYTGRPEGVALDIDHILMDIIHTMNRTGEDQAVRSYDNPERFLAPAELESYLEKLKKERCVEIDIYDPILGKSQTRSMSGSFDPRKIENWRKDIAAENMRRLEARVEELANGAERGVALRILKSTLENLDERGSKMEAEKQEAIGHAKEEALAEAKLTGGKLRFTALQTISADFARRAEALQAAREEALVNAIGGVAEYGKIRLRVQEIRDTEIAKFIYTLDGCEKLSLQHEVIKGDVTGRAAHSELAEGGNIYGGGEVIFQKHSKKFHSFDEWQRFQDVLKANPIGQWTLSEVNNGSGHYRPAVSTLPYTWSILKRALLDSIGLRGIVALPQEGPILRDCLLKGVGLREVGLIA